MVRCPPLTPPPAPASNPLDMGRIRDTWEDWDANRKLIAISAIGIFALVVRAAVARVEDVTRGMGKVIP